MLIFVLLSLILGCESSIHNSVVPLCEKQCSCSIPQFNIMREVYAVKAGHKVTFSSSWNEKHENYQLDTMNYVPSWSAKENVFGEWIEVAAVSLKYWKGIILQGGRSTGDYSQYVTSYKVLYSLNGDTWKYAEEGKIYEGNFDHSTKIQNDFAEPIEAKAIRIYPVSWHEHISLRFDAIYLE